MPEFALPHHPERHLKRQNCQLKDIFQRSSSSQQFCVCKGCGIFVPIGATRTALRSPRDHDIDVLDFQAARWNEHHGLTNASSLLSWLPTMMADGSPPPPALSPRLCKQVSSVASVSWAEGNEAKSVCIISLGVKPLPPPWDGQSQDGDCVWRHSSISRSTQLYNSCFNLLFVCFFLWRETATVVVYQMHSSLTDQLRFFLGEGVMSPVSGQVCFPDLPPPYRFMNPCPFRC